MGGLVAVVVVVVMAVVGAGWWWTSWEKVDPGNVGLLVDYGDGSIEMISETKWMWVGRYQKLHEYSTQEQTLIMDMGGEGQVKGDDSTMCTTSDSQSIKIDAATDWQIDTSRLVQTYQLRRDVPLVGPRGRDAPGNYLEDVIVRNDVRSAIYKICPTFGWADILGTKQQEFEDKVEADVKATSNQKGVQINRVTVRNRHPSDAIAQLMQARLQGQREQEQSAFQAAQQKRQQEIDLAASAAAGQKAQQEAEAKAKVDQTNASAAATVAKIKSDQEAEAIRTRGSAEAEALKAQASVVTPQLVDLERAKKWNGQGPTTVLGSDTRVVNEVPR